MPVGPNGFGRVDAAAMRGFVSFFVSAGLVNATIAALLLCRLPDTQGPSLRGLLMRAAIYVILGAASGVAGAYFYWRTSSNPYRRTAPISFGAFSLICAGGWVWVPAAVLLSAQDSKATAVIGFLCGVVLGTGLRKGIATPAEENEISKEPKERELFAPTLDGHPWEAHGYVIAGLIYAAGYAQHEGSHLVAGALCAMAGFLFAWKRSTPAREGTEDRNRRKAALRLAATGLAAILITAWALLLGVRHRNEAGDGAFAADGGDRSGHGSKRGTSALGTGGYESVVLWPFPRKKQLIPPIPEPANYLGLDRSHPMIIRFDGAYWYFQPPETQPGRTAHQARGTPLGLDIQASNSFPLMMEAHQRLVGPVRLARCGEIDVEIESRDEGPGAVSLGILLGNSESPGKATLYLGQKPLEDRSPALLRRSPAFERLRFPVPPRTAIRKFDEITVILSPDPEHALVAPKIAIQQFELTPR